MNNSEGTSQTTHRDGDAGPDLSMRSRASSVVSTGTKTSVGTLQRDDPALGNANLVREVLRLAAQRPGSILSNDSLGTPAPPYDAHFMSEALARRSSVSHDTPEQGNVPSADYSEAGDTSPPMMEDTDNALFAHYRRIVSIVDHNHQQQLAEMRQRIENIDQAYRKELKSRDREVERAHEDLAAQVEKAYEQVAEREAELLEQQEIAIDKARNQVEDIWELRWKDINRLKAEEMRRLELEGQKALEKAVADRDEEWIAMLGKKYPHLEKELRSMKDEFGGSSSTD